MSVMHSFSRCFAPLLALACALASTGARAGDPSLARYAVVRIPSHGGSGTVIETGPGRTLILSCAHAFQGADAQRPIKLDCPHNAAGQPKHVRIRLLAVGIVDRDDLSLIELNDGPLPYCAPVAPDNYSRRCLSVGYDEMKQPAQCRPAEILREDGAIAWTRERPWHGRSGGGLIDAETGCLIGVCSGYSGPSNHAEVWPGANGLYVSHAAIVRFLRGERGSAPRQAAPHPQMALPPRPAPGGFGFGPQFQAGPACPT